MKEKQNQKKINLKWITKKNRRKKKYNIKRITTNRTNTHNTSSTQHTIQPSWVYSTEEKKQKREKNTQPKWEDKREWDGVRMNEYNNNDNIKQAKHRSKQPNSRKRRRSVVVREWVCVREGLKTILYEAINAPVRYCFSFTLYRCYSSIATEPKCECVYLYKRALSIEIHILVIFMFLFFLLLRFILFHRSLSGSDSYRCFIDVCYTLTCLYEAPLYVYQFNLSFFFQLFVLVIHILTPCLHSCKEFAICRSHLWKSILIVF